ncbi:MAG TPA: nucleotidyltransferase family protein [Gemmataceae bacterium]|nr:nucleotidyltransferase family protein [Gemmataceae bacterium]
MIFAVVPAAGRSSRMGRPKLSLSLGGRTVLEHVVTALRQGGADEVLVIAGPHDPSLEALAKAAGAIIVCLTESTADMRATVELGLRWLTDHFHPRPDDAWLLAPADHPTLDAEVVRRLAEAYAAQPSASIVIPVHDGRRGHPTLIGWRHVENILARPAGKGINNYLRSQQQQIQEVVAPSADVLRDLDTPEDYDRLRSDFR